MFEELKNWEMLSQVWFVHDYIQLKFHDDHTINVYNPFNVENGGKFYKQGEFGYADTLVGIIGSKITEVSYKQFSHFSLTFSCGATFTIELARGLANIPEAFEMNLNDEQYIEFNA